MWGYGEGGWAGSWTSAEDWETGESKIWLITTECYFEYKIKGWFLKDPPSWVSAASSFEPLTGHFVKKKKKEKKRKDSEDSVLLRSWYRWNFDMRKKDNKYVGFTFHKMPASTNCSEFTFGCNKCNYYIYDIWEKSLSKILVLHLALKKKWSMHPYSLSLSAFEMVLICPHVYFFQGDYSSFCASLKFLHSLSFPSYIYKTLFLHSPF